MTDFPDFPGNPNDVASPDILSSTYDSLSSSGASGTIPGRQAYHLDIPGTASASSLSVVSFTATERMGAPTEARIVFTHPDDLPRADYLNREASFSISPVDGNIRRFSGFIARFSKLKTTADFSLYEVVLTSQLARLAAVHTSRIYQRRTIPQIIEMVLRRHGLEGHQFTFTLRGNHPQHDFRMQHDVDDLTYVQMLMQKEGIYSYVTEYGDQIVFGDDIDHYIYSQSAPVVPYRETAGLEAGIEAISSLRTHTQTVPQSYLVADYNPDQAWERYRAEASIAPQDATTYGQPYIYGTHHLDQVGARWEAQLRHEVAISWQVVYEGESNIVALQPARILNTDIKLEDAPEALVVIEVVHTGARDKAYTNTFKAIPSDRRFRLKLEEDKWPKINGSMSARVTSPNKYKYAYVNVVGYYIVRFDFDFDAWPSGGESVALRLAKPFAGALQTGFHFPALDGTEAVIEFRDGDPDKPYIAAFHHNSQAVDHITNDRRWLSRNVIRTQSNNKLRMEDWAGQEGIKLSTEHSGKSQLNLGHLVDNKLEKRGEGFELRTSGYGAIRGGRGLLVSSDDRPNAAGAQLDMQEAMAHLEATQAQMAQLAGLARDAQAAAIDAQAMNDVLQNQIKDLQQAVMVLTANASIALTSPETIQHSAGRNLVFTACENADIGVMEEFRVAAGKLVSLFAQQMGMKLIANQGKVEMQAQNDAMQFQALKDLTLTSVNGKLVLTAKNEVWIGADGSYIKINGNGIQNVTPGDIVEKCAAWDKAGPASEKQTATPPPAGNLDPCVIQTSSANTDHAALMGG